MSVALVTSSNPTPAGLSAAELARVKDLQVFPAIAMQALQLVKSPDCKISEFSSIVEKDWKLTADILRMANSCMFSAGKAVARIHPAVVRLGFRQVQNLIMSASLASMVKRLAVEDEWIRKLLWRHSLTTGLLAQQMNRELHLDFQGEEFTAGLIHDIGRLLFAVCVPNKFAEIDELEFDESPDLLAHEANVIHTNHCELGVWFATTNRIPPELVDVIRSHHRPVQSRVNRLLVTLTAVCDHMANYLQRTESVWGYDPASNPFVAELEECGVTGVTACFGELSNTVMESAFAAVEQMMDL